MASWVKGQTGNFRGRGGNENLKPMRDAIALELAEEKVVQDDNGKARKFRKLRLVARALVNKAVEGDVTAIRDVIDRIDGKPPQAHTGPDGKDGILIKIRHLLGDED